MEGVGGMNKGKFCCDCGGMKPGEKFTLPTGITMSAFCRAELLNTIPHTCKCPSETLKEAEDKIKNDPLNKALEVLHHSLEAASIAEGEARRLQGELDRIFNLNKQALDEIIKSKAGWDERPNSRHT